ncbi:MAG TPA: alpha-2-macroglobulin family protein [Pyrinomonadaceae bacterium]|nr:alpha-2-macroglobulin family protein [Pyrinomonadaceae bacterium]
MSRRWLLSLLCLAVLFFLSVQFTGARGELRVNEAKTKILFEKDPAEVFLEVDNPSLAGVNANVHIELLDPRDKVITKTTQVQQIARGSQTLKLSLPFAFPHGDNQLLLYRLHYRLAPQDSPQETIADGIISVSEMTSDVFELRISGAAMVREGDDYRVRVQAVHPITQEPAANVHVDGEVELDRDNGRIVKLDRSRVTDAKGRAVLDFQLSPSSPKVQSRTSNGELKVTGKKGAIVAETKGDLLVDQMPRILINTDKPLYQPGQVMHVRALLQSPSRRALANEETFFKISDPEGAVLYRAVATSSRFGIASIDWNIPENTRLGEFRIKVGVEGADDQATQYVRISRYELPNFKVNVETDRKFYLPGEDATVTVRADYLFGQPVLRGRVRVVRESDRSWNYREQKWELREESEQKGETKPDGSFVAKLDLSSFHEDLAGSDYNRFDDISFAAYFTDPTTNRTEQRRFDVRVTKEQIHVYVIDTYQWSFSRKLPLKFHISTFYADGTPARCKVNVTLTDDADDDDEIKKRVATVTTNRYGLAQISTRLPKEFEDDNDVDVVLSASDSSGRKGSNTEEINLDSDSHVRIETPKTIYRRGEPITAEVIGTEPEQTVVVDLALETGLVRTERVRLRGGRALIAFPYRSEFKNKVTVVAYPESAESRSAVAIHTVIYPYNSELEVRLQSSRDTYRPGEDAQLNFSVSSARDRSEESALGVVVLDQAVVERFRTDQEFGGGYYALDYAIERFLGLEDQVAGISLRDLQRLNASEPVSPEMDMVAAVLLRNSANYMPEFYSGDEFDQNAERLFGDSIKKQLSPVKEALSNHYVRTMKYPANEKELSHSLSQSGIDFNAVRDPWGMAYRTAFFVDKQADTLRFVSSGPDKRFDTNDDFAVDRMSWAYFRPLGEAIDRAVTRYHERTGKFIRNATTLRDEVLTDGFHLDQTYDRWGQPYQLDFEVEGSSFVLRIRSGGPDKQFATPGQYAPDDFVIWQSAIDYFAEARAQISNALNESFNRTNKFPQSDRELAQVLRGVGDLRDPWDRPYYNTFSTQSVFTDRVRLEDRATFGQAASLRTNITPVTQTLGHVVMRSVGPDGRPATLDDFPVGTFTVVLSEQPRGAPTPVVLTSGVVLTGPNGAIIGTVIDHAGAAVPGTTVTATRLPDGPTTVTSTDDSGRYSFSILAPGTYQITFDAAGFRRGVIDQVVVRPQNITEVNITLEVGQVAETVSVTAGEAPMMTLQTATSITERRVKELPAAAAKAPKQLISTPRLREYFPETLLWQPSIETDKQGRAQVNFKLADNITTWKVMVIGSTEDGRIGTTEKDIKAFQPFFVEHDPPRVLTEGDEISLPVVIRNYLSQTQKVGLEIKPESWFALLGPAQKQTSVVAGDAMRETFDFRVIGSVKDGKQRITARGTDEQDAIEKPVSVHPDGQEMSVTAGDLLDDATVLNLDIAENVVPNSSRGELKIYPNLLSHVVEGVEGIMQRPYGCGEQTISSTYPSLLLLRHFKKSGESFPLSARAGRYLKDGYSRLLNYGAEEGGFTYWGYGQPDLALSAYALQFLNDARELIDVDQDVVKQAREWLVKQQRPDGSWRHPYWNEGDNPSPNIVLTAYVARVLARTDGEASEPLKRALNFLDKESQRTAEPYLLASYALAAADAKDAKESGRAKPAVEKLRTLALEEGNTSYWAIETNTPFYGWGRVGRVETTALVIQALANDCNSQTPACEANKKLINRGLLFLLKEKDRYGVWSSTQATVNVLDAMLVLFSHRGPTNAPSQSTADVVVNGNRMQTVQLDHRLNNPVTVNISEFLKAGKNSIELKRLDGLPFASVQAVANYYVPWGETKPANNHSTSDLRLEVKFDKTAAKINEDVTCRVEAARVGFRGYGMLLAEIGIPPGAEVDRSSLEKASKDWTINRYDVLPDRVVFYLWPRAGGVSFDFKFRPRFGLKAKSSASILYDYYNPEATVVVAPSLFTVR